MPKQKYNAFSIHATILIIFITIITAITSFIYLQNTKYSGKYDDSKKIAFFNGENYKVPTEYVDTILNQQNIEEDETSNVLGSKSKKGEKIIKVDLGKQKLYAYEGDKKKYSFDISSGKWNKTPTGEFRIWTKLKYTLMTGGSKEEGTYYYLPNVPYTMFFYKDYGIHGAYWHNNFGHPMSHGCINMRPEEAKKLFYWANPPVPDNKNSILATNNNKGTKVIIYGKTPKE